MTSSGSPAFRAHFAALRDLRQGWKILYPLQKVPLVALSGTIAGAEDFVEIRRWAATIQDALVAIDAMGCQTKIAQTIPDRGADSVPSSASPRYSPMPSVPTGRCRIASAGCSMSCATKTSAECTPVLVRRTCPPSATWHSSCCTAPGTATASSYAAYRLGGMSITRR